MKKITIFTLALLFLSACSTNNSSENNLENKTFQSPELNLQFTYPAQLEVGKNILINEYDTSKLENLTKKEKVFKNRLKHKFFYNEGSKCLGEDKYDPNYDNPKNITCEIFQKDPHYIIKQLNPKNTQYSFLAGYIEVILKMDTEDDQFAKSFFADLEYNAN